MHVIYYSKFLFYYPISNVTTNNSKIKIPHGLFLRSTKKLKMENTNSSGSAYAVKTAEAEKTQKISVKKSTI